MDAIIENDLVALLADQPDAGLRRGDVGTVIHVFDTTGNHPRGFVVEFVNEAGTVQSQIDITDPSLVLKLLFRCTEAA
jgi:hypothetical protein